MEDIKITIKPSIEKIPDEYEHFTEKEKIEVHIFSSSGEDAQNKVKEFRNVFNERDFVCKQYSLENDNCPIILNNSK